MFQKFINSLKKIVKDLSSEEIFTLSSSIGLVFIGFLIYGIWQTRLPEESTEEVEINENEDENQNQEEEEEEKNNLVNEIHNYTIKDLKNEITKREKGIIFNLEENSEFAIEYKGVTHAVFPNDDDLSIEDWLHQKINEKGPTDATLEEQKDFLDIVIIRDTETPIGSGKEVVRINGTQSEELFVPRDDYVLSFYYQGENSEEILNKKTAREKLINKIN